MYSLRSAPDLVPFTRVRIVLERLRESNTPARDTTIEYPAGADSLAVTLDVPIRSLTGTEGFNLSLAMIDAEGDTVFRARGPVSVHVAGRGQPSSPVQVPATYVGTGANAASLRFATRDTTARFGDTVTVTAHASTAAGAVIPGTPIEYSTLDTALVSVPSFASARFVARNRRGVARIVARTLTGQADTARIVVRPVPAALLVHGGNEQTGRVGAVLPVPISARVMATDGLPMDGVSVRFTVSDPTGTGGSVSATDVVSNTDGVAATIWTLGTRPGGAVLSATIPAFGAVGVARYIATVSAGPPAAIVITAMPTTATYAMTLTPHPVVQLRDAGGNDVVLRGVYVTATISSGAALVGSIAVEADDVGRATFYNLGITGPSGTYTITFSATLAGVPVSASAPVTLAQ